MDLTPTTILLVGVVCVVLGFLANVLLSTLASDTEAPVSAVDEAPPGGRKGRYTPVVRLWRERGSGTLVVEMDGKGMVSAEPLNEVQRERLERSARDLRAWLGMGLAGHETADGEPEQLHARDVDLERAVSAETVIPVPMPAPVTPSTAHQPSEPVQRSAVDGSHSQNSPYTPARGVPPVVPVQKGKEETAAAPSSRSIVMQIEDILQDMIAETPLAQRGIHLTEDPSRGVIVQVGLEHFEGIDAVTDPEIKGVIRSAVVEWEKNSS